MIALPPPPARVPAGAGACRRTKDWMRVVDQVSRAAKPSLKGSGKAYAPDETSPWLLSSMVRLLPGGALLTPLKQRSLLWSWKRVRVGGPIRGHRGFAAHSRQLVQAQMERDGGIKIHRVEIGASCLTLRPCGAQGGRGEAEKRPQTGTWAAPSSSRRTCAAQTCAPGVCSNQGGVRA